MSNFAASTIYRPAPKGLYSINRCQALVAPRDPVSGVIGTALKSVGDALVKVNHQVEYEDILSMEDSFHSMVDSIPVSRKCEVEVKVRSFDALVSALSFQSQPGVLAPQPAAAQGLVDTFNGVRPGYVYTLLDSQVVPQFVAFPNIKSVTDDSAQPVAYVAGVNYLVDNATGRVEVLSIPAGAKTDVNGNTNMLVTFDIPAPVAGQAPAIYGLMNNPSQYWYLGVRTNNRTGMNRWYEWTNVIFQVEGGMELGTSGNEVTAVTLKGKVLLDPLLPPDRNFGFIRDLLPMSALGA